MRKSPSTFGSYIPSSTPASKEGQNQSRSYFGFEIPEIPGRGNTPEEVPPQIINIISLIRYIEARKEAIVGFQNGSHNHVIALLKNPKIPLEEMNRFLTLKRIELLIQVPEKYHEMWKKVIRTGNSDNKIPFDEKLTNLEVLSYISKNGYGHHLLECMLEHAAVLLNNRHNQGTATQISVNAFVSDLLQEKTMDNFRSLSSIPGMNVSRLHIEILEDVSNFILQDPEKMSTFVNSCKELQRMGYQLSIDDLIPSALSSSVNVSAKIQNILHGINPGSMAIKFQGEFVRQKILDTKEVLKEDVSYFKEILSQSREGTFERTRNIEDIAKLYRIFGKEFMDKITFQSFHLNRFL